MNYKKLDEQLAGVQALAIAAADARSNYNSLMRRSEEIVWPYNLGRESEIATCRFNLELATSKLLDATLSLTREWSRLKIGGVCNHVWGHKGPRGHSCIEVYGHDGPHIAENGETCDE